LREIERERARERDLREMNLKSKEGGIDSRVWS